MLQQADDVILWQSANNAYIKIYICRAFHQCSL